MLILFSPILIVSLFVFGNRLLREELFIANKEITNQNLPTPSDQTFQMNTTDINLTEVSTSIGERSSPIEFPIVASRSQNGVTVSILWVYADATRTTILYKIVGVDVPEGFMLPCPVLRAVLTENGAPYPEYVYAEPISDIRSHCIQIEDGIYTISQSFYRNHELVTSLNLRFDVAVGGMTLYTENGVTLQYPQSGVFSFDLNTDTAGQWTIEEPQVADVNKINITLHKLELNPSLVDAYLCVDFENDKEWIPKASLSVGNDQEKLEAYEQLDPAGNPVLELTPTRCFRLTFPLQKKLQSGDRLTIQMPGLIIDAFNVMTEEDCANALQHIQQKYPEINFVCYFDNRGGGRGGGFEVISRPSAMNDDQVFELFRSELQSEVVGPWNFSITVP